MKDFLIGAIFTSILSLLFGFFCTSKTTQIFNRFGNIYSLEYSQGEHDAALPGNGDFLAQAIKSFFEEEAKKQTEVETKDEPFCTQVKHYELCERKEQNINMSEILISFWHGVVSVLIGETCTLMLATAWLKMKKHKEEETN